LIDILLFIDVMTDRSVFLPEHTHILLATLGGQPQVVTFTLDLLLRDGFPISEVFVIHPKATDPRLQHSLACLKEQFVDDRYHIDGRIINCRFDSRTLRLNSVPIADILDDVGAVGAHETIYHLIRELKQQRQCIVHLSATGGRRIMALLAISAAQLNFKHTDHIWHIYTPKEFRQRADEGAIMHASSEDDVSLFTVPFVPWGNYFPGLPQSPDGRGQMDPQELERCTRVMIALTESQQNTLKAFARGLNRKQVAGELHISLKTVDAHKTIIYLKCCEVWNVPSDEPITYHFLKEKFARYFASAEYTPPRKELH
jgi:CRISPR-associated protein Csx14